MAARGSRVDAFKGAIAFVISIVVGIAVGYFCVVTEALEDKLKNRDQHSTKRTKGD